MSNLFSCNVTGHRKIVPQGYTGGAWWAPACPVVQQYHTDIQQQIMLKVVELYQNSGVVEFISGGAIGADILFAEIIIQLRDIYSYPITLGIAKPFPEQSAKWQYQTVIRYDKILSLANWVHTVSPGPYSPHKMQVRNEWMVNRAGILIAVWNDIPKGGTWNCINYARSKKRNIITINV